MALSVLKMALSALMTLTLGSWESSLFFRSIQSVGDNNFKKPTKKNKKPPKVKQLKQLVEEKRCEGWVLGFPTWETCGLMMRSSGHFWSTMVLQWTWNMCLCPPTSVSGMMARFLGCHRRRRRAPPCMYAALLGNRQLDEVFNHNFLETWRSKMTDTERKKICDISKCDFSEISKHFKAEKTKDR